MKKTLLVLVGLLGSIFNGYSTTCPNAVVIPAAQTLPYTTSLVCGTTNDMTSANVNPGTGGFF